MPVRAAWRSRLLASIGPAESEADRLANRFRRVPVDLVALADALNADVVIHRTTDGRHGTTTRHGDRYLVRVDALAGGSGLGSRQRFNIAHELAHVILLDMGVAPPAGKAEYWLLENCVNRIAGRLLVPRWLTPSNPVTPAEVVRWLDALTARAGLSQPAAAKELALAAPNARGTIGTRTRPDGSVVVAWHLANDGVDLPRTGRLLAEEHPLVTLHHRASASAADRYSSAALEDNPGIDAVATSLSDTTAVIFLARDDVQRQLQLFTPAPLSSSSRHSEINLINSD
jgi:hypothetical protein